MHGPEGSSGTTQKRRTGFSTTARVLRAVGHFFCHGRRSAKLLGRACWYLMQGAQNAQRTDMNANGEGWLVDRLAGSLEGRAVLDIGANAGDWSARVLAAAPGARICAVEMIPAFAERLRARFGDRAMVVECGVSDGPGEITAYQVGDDGRVLPGVTAKAHVATPVRLRTGDAIVAEAGIADVALIKIDVDGYDIPALRGLRETIAGSRPVIQFEYSRFYIESRYYLRDAYAFLEPFGYRIGRLMPARIDFLPYHYALETFLTNNFVAVPLERQI